jgi:hypothetical protein
LSEDNFLQKSTVKLQYKDSLVSITLMMEAVSSSQTSISIYQTTRRNIPENSHLFSCRRENLKSHPTEHLFQLIAEVKQSRLFTSMVFILRHVVLVSDSDEVGFIFVVLVIQFRKHRVINTGNT